jgi:hypothetical protein
MHRSLLIRDRKLVSNDFSMVRVAVFSGGLVVEKCHFLRMTLEVDLYHVAFCFDIFICVPFIYGAFVFIAPFLQVYFVLYKYLVINNIIFAVQKKNKRGLILCSYLLYFLRQLNLILHNKFLLIFLLKFLHI